MNHVHTAWVVLPLALIAGCASDPNKEVKTAQAAEAETVRQNRDNQAEANRQATVENAEAKQNATHEDAQHLSPGTSDRVAAQADMKAARERYAADAQARLEKVHARLDESKKKLQIAGTKAPMAAKNQVDSAYGAYDTVKTQFKELSTVSNESWNDATRSMNQRLDELEKVTDDALKRASDVKY